MTRIAISVAAVSENPKTDALSAQKTRISPSFEANPFGPASTSRLLSFKTFVASMLM